MAAGEVEKEGAQNGRKEALLVVFVAVSSVLGCLTPPTNPVTHPPHHLFLAPLSHQCPPLTPFKKVSHLH